MVRRRPDRRHSSKLLVPFCRQRGGWKGVPDPARSSTILTLHAIARARVFGDLFPFAHLAQDLVSYRPAGRVCDRARPRHRAHAQRIFPSNCERWKTSVEDVHPADRKHRLLRSGYRLPGVSRSEKDPAPRETAIPPEEPVELVLGGPLEMSSSLPMPREKHVVIWCLLLVMATLAFYNPIVRNQFVDFDDLSYIVKNPQVQRGLTWGTVKWSFTTFREGNWHPLTWLSHALDYQLFHLNPAGHHYTNLLLHAANAVLLFLLLLRATGSGWPSFLVAALFALHPVNVESVAWAAERKNVLSMMFFLLA